MAVEQNTDEMYGLHMIRRKWRGIAAVFFLFVVGAWLGSYSYHAALEAQGNPLGTLLPEFKPAVLFASGRGMIIPEAFESPELDAFLALEAEEFAPACLPEEIPGAHLFVSSMNSFALSHWLLFYSVGWCWYIFGISHTALAFLCAFFYGIAAVALYFLFRLGMGRILSGAGALMVMLLPPFLCIAPQLRDFSKAPFILLFLAIVGTLLKERYFGSKLLRQGILLGALVGIGYGFRQDILICLPVAIFVLFAAPLQGNRCFLYRISAVLLVLGMFAVTAFPVLLGVRSDSGSVSTHTLFQGVSRQAEQEMEFGDAAYELLLRPYDTEVHAVVNAHARLRGFTEPMDFYLSPAYGRAGRQIFLEWARMFPADLFARGLASIEATTRLSTLASEYYTFATFSSSGLGSKLQPYYNWYHRYIERFGLFFLFGALLIIAIRSVRLATVTLLILAWFMAYPNLLFEVRHAFHLAFVTPWALLFIGASLGRFALSATRAFFAKKKILFFRSKRTLVPAFMLLAVVLVGAMGILAGLRMVQHHRMRRLEAIYQNASLEVVETIVETEDYRALVKPAYPLPALRESWNLPMGDVATEYLVLEFSPCDLPIPVTVAYQPGRGADFTRQITVPASTSGQGNLRYFVPVYEMANYMPVVFSQLKHRFTNSPVANLLIHRWGVNRFLGIRMYEKDLPFLKEIYRVTDKESLPWLFYLQTKTEKPLKGYCKRMRLEKELHALPIELQLMMSGDAERAVTAYLGLLNCFSGHRSFAQRVRMLIPQITDEKHRVDALCRLARYMPDWAGKIAVEVAAVGDIFRQKKEYDQAEDIYMQALILSPTDLGYQVKLADALFTRGESSAALEHYRSVLLTAPESPYSAGQFDRVCMEQGEPDEAARFWKVLHKTYSTAAVPALHLGYALEREDRIEEALILYRQIEQHHPNNAEALLRQGILLAILEGYAKGRVVMDRALDRAPDLHPDLVAGLTRIAAYYTETGAHAFAEAIYREVMELAPDNGWHQVRYAEALMAQENYSKAQEVFVDILQGAPESPYSADKLDEIFERIEEPALRVSTWKSLYTRYPEAFIPVLHYGKALEDKGDHNEALLQYRILHDSHPDQPELMLRLGMLTARIEGYDTGRLLMDGAVAAEQSLASLRFALLTELAEYFFGEGNSVRAETLYRELLQSPVEKVFIQTRLAEVLERQGHYDEALEFCCILMQHDPESSHIASLVDLIYDKKQDSEGRIEEWRSLHLVLPESVIPAVHLGRAYEADQQLENAHQVYAEAVRYAPENAVLKLRYGILIALLEDYDRGRALMDAALIISPELSSEMAGGLAEIAGYEREEEDREQTESLYREAISLAPNEYWHGVHFGEWLMEQGREAEALGLFVEVLMARPESPHTAALIDCIYASQKKGKKCLETWRDITEKQPDAVVPRYHLGRALEDNGRPEDALDAYILALRSNPAYTQAQKAIDRLTPIEE